MSLLGTPVYANPSTPIWLPSSGNASVTGNVTAVGGDVVSQMTADPQARYVGIKDPFGSNVIGFTNTASYSVIQSSDDILFALAPATTANSALLLSTAGSDGDTLDIGGTVNAQFLALNNSGPKASIGTGTLLNGVLIVNTSACTSQSVILLTHDAKNASAAIGTLQVKQKTSGQFIVNSLDASGNLATDDLSDFNWMIVNPAI